MNRLLSQPRTLKFKALFKDEDYLSWEYIDVNEQLDDLLYVVKEQITDWLQFVERFDEDGKEVYVGDIIEGIRLGNPITGVVAYDVESLQYYLYRRKSFFPLSHIKIKKVLGSAFETPLMELNIDEIEGELNV